MDHHGQRLIGLVGDEAIRLSRLFYQDGHLREALGQVGPGRGVERRQSALEFCFDSGSKVSALRLLCVMQE